MTPTQLRRTARRLLARADQEERGHRLPRFLETCLCGCGRYAKARGVSGYCAKRMATGAVPDLRLPSTGHGPTLADVLRESFAAK